MIRAWAPFCNRCSVVDQPEYMEKDGKEQPTLSFTRSGAFVLCTSCVCVWVRVRVCVCASQPLVLLVSSPSSACMWQCNFEGTACWISALKKWKSCWRKRKKSIGRCRGFGSTNNICCIKTKNLNPQLCLSEHEQQLRAHCWRFAATSAAELGSQRVVHFSECFVCYTKKKKSPCLWKEMPRIA